MLASQFTKCVSSSGSLLWDLSFLICYRRRAGWHGWIGTDNLEVSLEHYFQALILRETQAGWPG